MGEDGYSREYNDNYNRQYSDKYDRMSPQDSKYRGYNENQRLYRDEQRSKYAYKDIDFCSENKKNYSSEAFYRYSIRDDGHRRSNDYYHKSENAYYHRGSDLDYVSKKVYCSDEYIKKPRMDSRYINNNSQDNSFYSKDVSYNKAYRAKHVPADPNCSIGVFGFNPNTTEDDLKKLLVNKLSGLSDYTYKLIMDEKTLLCKGYCFINFKCLNDAITAKYILNSESYRGQDFKCDYSYK